MEDVRMLPTLLHSAGGLAQPGTFVKMGSVDAGLSYTAMLEECFGWNGLRLEANPEACAKLNVSGRSAPCVNSRVCLHSPGSASVAKQRREQLATRVLCESLQIIMKRHGYMHADLLSLDVGGAYDKRAPMHRRSLCT